MNEFDSGNWRVPPPQPSLLDAQPALFDPPARCTSRGCEAGDRKNLCAWAADIAHGRKDPYTPKPRGCLLRTDPRDGEIPY